MTKKMSHIFHLSDFLDDDYIKGLIRLMSNYPGRKYILLHEPGYPLNDVVAVNSDFMGCWPKAMEAKKAVWRCGVH